MMYKMMAKFEDREKMGRALENLTYRVPSNKMTVDYDGLCVRFKDDIDKQAQRVVVGFGGEVFQC